MSRAGMMVGMVASSLCGWLVYPWRSLPICGLVMLLGHLLQHPYALGEILTDPALAAILFSIAVGRALIFYGLGLLATIIV